MTEYQSNTTYDAVAARMRAASRILLVTHAKPDGDALGSILALGRGLRSMAKPFDAFVKGPIPPGLRLLIGSDQIHAMHETAPPDQYDLVVVLDTGAIVQLDPIGKWIQDRRAKVIILDHHAHGDDIAAMRIVERHCASAAQVVLRTLDALDVPVTGGPFGIAEALFVGLATDTGWFKFSNADSEAFRAAARLLDCGADKSRLYAMVEENNRPQRLALAARAMASVRFVSDGAAAVMSLTPDDFRQSGGSLEDLTGIVNEPLSIAAVRVSVLLTSVDGSLTKISLRSKPAIEVNGRRLPGIDVDAVARPFGGGGHFHAAGAKRSAPIEHVRAEVEAALVKAMA